MFMLMVEPPAIVYQVENRDTHSEMDAAYKNFLKEHPVASIKEGEQLRSREYKRLDTLNQVYLDFTGGSLYALSQLQQHLKLLKEGVFGNPHSSNPTSAVATELMRKTREDILRYFNASPSEYTVVFTPNATGALKLVGESYPFEPGSNYLLTVDNHNSVNGIREYARAKGAITTYVPIFMPDLRVDENMLDDFLNMPLSVKNNLFAYPAQSNFSGVQHPLEWIARAQAKGWDVLLDAAAFVPTSRLDLGKWHPDFVDLSFYKMFGYPTGLGCLILKHSALAKLVKPWFSGGSIEYVAVYQNTYELKSGFEAFEDGTVNYLGIPAISDGLHHLEKVGVEAIHERIMALTDWLIHELLALRHANGNPLITVYGPSNTTARGATVAMNFLDPDGNVFDGYFIEQEAKNVNISLRTGCFCNPGVLEVINGISYDLWHTNKFSEKQSSPARCEKVISFGAVRVSLGIASNFADVYRFVVFARSLLNKHSRANEKSSAKSLLSANKFGC